MSFTLLIWLLLFAMLAVLAFVRPAYGVALYMLTYFLCPPFWWWGDLIEGYRWNLYSGLILLAAIVISRITGPSRAARPMAPLARRICWIGALLVVNATFVHFLLASDTEVSAEAYSLLAKFMLLFFMIHLSVRTELDFRIVLMSILLGAAYNGYEVTVNDRGKVVSNRLEGIGAPAASGANQFASLMVTVLPLTGAFFLAGRKWEKLAMLPAAPFIVNVLLLCNSRGAFLGSITSAVVFLLAAPPQTRKQALKVVALGAVATWFLLGDARIVERFLTTFADAEERDSSAQSRIDFAKAGIAMIEDHPFGAGGDGFKKVHGLKYLRQTGVADEVHAIHNGFLNEACEWGLQGLTLRLAFVISTIVLIRRTNHRFAEGESTFHILIGCALAAGMAGFLVTCLFGDRLDNEWGYWIAGLAIAHSSVQAAVRPARPRVRARKRSASVVDRRQGFGAI